MGNALLFPVISVGLAPGPLEKSLESIIGTFPIGRLLDELDEPPILDCKEILLQFTGKNGEEGEEEDSDEDDDFFSEENDDTANTPPEEEEEEEDPPSPPTTPTTPPVPPPPPDEPPPDEDELTNDEKECAMIELTWLKIILIILKVLKILRMIIDIVLSVIVTILQILQWAIGAWLNPPNIALIAQYIVEMVTAIIIMIIAMLLQWLWSLLNLDCIGDITADMLAQIQQAISMFSSIASAFNPNSINLLLDKLNEVTDPLEAMMDQAKSKKEEWQKFRNQMKDIGGTMSTVWEDSKKQLMEGLQSGLINNPQIASVRGIYNQTKGIINDVKKTMKSIQSAWDAKNIAESKAAGIKALIDAGKLGRNTAAEFTAMLASPFIDLEGQE
jgi:hypothetical protein